MRQGKERIRSLGAAKAPQTTTRLTGVVFADRLRLPDSLLERRIVAATHPFDQGGPMRRREMVTGAAAFASGMTSGAMAHAAPAAANDMEQAVNRALDRIGADFARDAASFVDTVAQSMTGLVDHFDTLVSRRLMNEQPTAAQEFLSMRIKATKLMGEVSKTKETQLKSLQDEAKAKARPR
jgi:hypothetical protein